MMTTQPVDLLVIGGGMAGSVAAAVAARAGLTVALLRKGYGATALSSGAIDLHEEEGLAEAVAFFLAEMDAVGYPYVGDPTRPATLLTVLGAPKRCALYPATVSAGAMEQWSGGRLLFLGVRGLAEHNAAYLARAAQRLASAEATAVEVDFPGVRHTHNIFGFELAQLLDDGAILEQFAEVVRQAVAGGVYTHVALPPIMGLERNGEAMAAVRAACGLSCFELLSVPPSLLGLRLQNALQAMLQRHRVQIIWGLAERFWAEAGQIVRLMAVDRDTTYEFIPRAVVLASGKFIGGGLVHEGRLREALFDLPLWIGDRLVGEAQLRELSAERFAERQPFMAAGLRTDEVGRPLGADGRPAYENLWAAGAVLQGSDYAAGCGNLGAALVGGYRVGRWISEHV